MASKVRQRCSSHVQLRSKNGCLPCRRRRKKCDETRPACIGCLRNHLICAWPDGQHGTDMRSTFGLKDLVTKDISLSLPQWSGSSIKPLSLHEEQRAKLFDHYIARTAPRLASKCQPENPFLTYNLHVAWLSETMQHTLLALSSADLLHCQPYMAEVSRTYYAVALRLIKHELTAWSSMTSTLRLSLLASTLTLCWFEIIDCNQDGALYHHLSASKTMLQELIQSNLTTDHYLLGFFVEQYAYMAIISSFTLRQPTLYRKAQDPSLYDSLEPLNQGSSIYGFLFGNGHRFFELIPRIAKLAHQRHLCGEIPSASVVADFNYLCHQLEGTESTDSGLMALLSDDCVVASRLYQEACYIFLCTSYHGPYSPTDNLRSRIQPHIDKFLELYTLLSFDSGPWTTTIWPMVIAGSCTTDPGQQQLIISVISTSTRVFGMPCYAHALQLVMYLWDAQKKDPTFYGPWGIQQVMEIKQINLCMG